MPDVDPRDIIWIVDAAREFQKSRAWLDEQVDKKRLSVISMGGDKRLYLLRSEIAALLAPHITQHREEHAG